MEMGENAKIKAVFMLKAISKTMTLAPELGRNFKQGKHDVIFRRCSEKNIDLDVFNDV